MTVTLIGPHAHSGEVGHLLAHEIVEAISNENKALRLRAGGREANLCRPGLQGTYCRSCIEPFHFYVSATTGHSNASYAHCEPCANVARNF